MSKIAVLGPTGMLGSALVYYLRRAGYDVEPIDRRRFSFTSDAIEALDLRGMSIAVNAVGLINRRIDTDSKDFYLINSLFPRVLADYCEKKSVKLIHISTDCIFDGKRGLYTEEDVPSADDLYGRSKALGEPRNCMVLRTSIIGPELRNHYNLLCWVLSQKSPIRGFKNHLWNGVTSVQLSRVVDQIISDDLFRYCIHNIYSSDISKLELIKLICNSFSCRLDVIPWDDDISRDMRLRTIYPDFISDLKIPTIEDQIIELSKLSTSTGSWQNLTELKDLISY
jgi:dTDP-4-dehydrorhamnose reductase